MYRRAHYHSSILNAGHCGWQLVKAAEALFSTSDLTAAKYWTERGWDLKSARWLMRQTPDALEAVFTAQPPLRFTTFATLTESVLTHRSEAVTFSVPSFEISNRAVFEDSKPLTLIEFSRIEQKLLDVIFVVAKRAIPLLISHKEFSDLGFEHDTDFHFDLNLFGTDGVYFTCPELLVKYHVAMVDNDARIAWDKTFLETADNIAKAHSKCMSKKVCAIAVRDNRIIATGINGTPPGQLNCCDVFPSVTEENRAQHREWSALNELHAEHNLLNTAAREGISIKGAVLYVNLQPCKVCSILLTGSGIERICYLTPYDFGDEEQNARIIGSAGIGYGRHPFKNYREPSSGPA